MAKSRVEGGCGYRAVERGRFDGLCSCDVLTYRRRCLRVLDSGFEAVRVVFHEMGMKSV